MSLHLKTILICFIAIQRVIGHGWINEPAPRNAKTSWPEMNCGTFARQWYYNGGKCGICGNLKLLIFFEF